MVTSNGQKIKDLVALGAILVVYVGLAYAGMPCPIRYFTGISCAGCGMTRAWSAFLHGDPAAAFRCHPLFPLPAVAIMLWLLHHRIPVRLYRVLMLGIVLLFLTVYGWRLLDTQEDIVVFDPVNGMILRSLRLLCKGLASSG